MSSDGVLRSKFSHIYVEDEVSDRPECRAILSHFPKAHIVHIHHYKDVFNRSRQDVMLQYQTQNLILAANHGQLVYPGAKVCQDFGNRHFYYTSVVMNCVFNCEYCYLKGLYPSGNMVIFLNIEDVFSEVEQLLRKYPVYLCVSYDTDLVALEGVTGFVRKWIDFTRAHDNLTIEIRTKSGNTTFLNDLCDTDACDRCIFAYTLSPEIVIERYEHGTSSLNSRIDAMKAVHQKGFPVRAVFDPIIRVPNWKTLYSDLVDTFFKNFDAKDLYDASVGTFRISDAYLKNMRRAMNNSSLVQYPFTIRNGVAEYEDAEEMEQFMIQCISKYLPKEKTFLWKV